MLALLVNPNFAGAEDIIRSVQEAASAKRLQLRILKAATESEINAAFGSLVELQAGALLVSDPTFLAVASRSWRSRNARRFRRYMNGANSPRPAV